LVHAIPSQSLTLSPASTLDCRYERDI